MNAHYMHTFPQFDNPLLFCQFCRVLVIFPPKKFGRPNAFKKKKEKCFALFSAKMLDLPFLGQFFSSHITLFKCVKLMQNDGVLRDFLSTRSLTGEIYPGKCQCALVSGFVGKIL